MILVQKTGLNNAHHYEGLSTEVKPTNIPTGSTFFAIDTGVVYIYSHENNTWYTPFEEE